MHWVPVAIFASSDSPMDQTPIIALQSAVKGSIRGFGGGFGDNRDTITDSLGA